jgi:two-component system chemotaxis response regulator CheY
MSALVADDEAHMRTFFKLMLTDIGINKVYLMRNGMDAVEAFQEYQPDVVLMDINMNKMNGIDALSHIRKIDPNAKVIMMTAVSARDVVIQSKTQGAAHYILKTQEPAKIRELIIKTLSISL